MDWPLRIAGIIAVGIVLRAFVWPALERALSRSTENWLDRKYGKIYSMRDVDPRLGVIAEAAIAKNNFIIAGADDSRRLVISTTEPVGMVALISSEPSFTGGAPDLVIHAVYEGEPASNSELIRRLVCIPVDPR